MLTVTILGNNSALPAYDRHPTAQTIDIRDQLFLMDCGEGTQKQMSRYNIHQGRINHIFVSHLHGDHYFGLIGLLSSMALWNRQKPLYLYAPPLLKKIIEIQFEAVGSVMSFALHFHPIEPDFSGVLIDTEHYYVRCFPVNHRIPCHGFAFCEKSSGRKINVVACHEFAIPKAFYSQLKRGEDYITKEGQLIENNKLTFQASPDKVYAYCADTRKDDAIIPHIRNANLLYHESTFLNDNEEKAFLRYHSTAKQAAEIALEAGVGKLLLGHYSSRYQDLSLFEKEAGGIFANCEATLEGKSYDLK